MVRLLIGSGLSSLDPEDFLHELLYAVRFGRTAVVQLLLESVNVNCVTALTSRVVMATRMHEHGPDP